MNLHQDLEYKVYCDLSKQADALAETSRKILESTDFPASGVVAPRGLDGIGIVLLQQMGHVSGLLGCSVLFKARENPGYDPADDKDVQRAIAAQGEAYKAHELLRLRDIAIDPYGVD